MQVYIAKTKALISFVVTAKLICFFVSAYAKSRFSHDTAQITVMPFLTYVSLLFTGLLFSGFNTAEEIRWAFEDNYTPCKLCLWEGILFSRCPSERTNVRTKVCP